MGQVFVVSGVLLGVVAALFGLGVIPVAQPVRPQGFALGPRSQLRHLARILAAEVLPTPR